MAIGSLAPRLPMLRPLQSLSALWPSQYGEDLIDPGRTRFLSRMQALLQMAQRRQVEGEIGHRIHFRLQPLEALACVLAVDQIQNRVERREVDLHRSSRDRLLLR